MVSERCPVEPVWGDRIDEPHDVDRLGQVNLKARGTPLVRIFPPPVRSQGDRRGHDTGSPQRSNEEYPSSSGTTKPLWGEEFSGYASEDAYVLRRQLTKFLVLTSFGMAAGNA
jgi:hypothetical protein